MVYRYDPEDYTKGLGFLKIIFAWQNTVLPQVLRSGLFWCNMLLHFAFQLLARTLPERTASSSSSTAPVVSSVGDTEATVDDSSLNRRLLGAGARLWSGMELMDPAPQTLPEVDWRVASVTLSLLVFFLVRLRTPRIITPN